jgi:exopolyphosphatase/guanosine-5'-triphosphate,3'-diphosphate pyrophosphatase
MKYFPDGKFSERAFREAQIAAGAELEEAIGPFAPRHWREALGSSGTVGAVSQVLAASGRGDGTVTPEGLRWLMQCCLEAGHADRLDLPGLRDDRRAVIAGGLSLLYTLAMNFGIAELQPARGALRQGVIFDLAARTAIERRVAAAGKDIREGSVRELQRRFQVDTAQAERVATVALALLDDVAPETASEARRELRWAAALHEAGMMISHHDHHRHSAYVLSHVDAAGFSQSQLRRIGDLVLGQRGGLRKLEARLQETAFALHLLCLRLAVIVCHARGDVAPGEISLVGGSKQPTLTPAPGWTETHPRALHLLREEVEAWSRTGLLQPALAPS